MQCAKIYSAEPSLVKPDVPKFKIGGSSISRSLDNLSKTATVKPDDWRTSLIHYLDNSGHVTDRKVRWQALKYVLLDHDLYC
jgi:hypothetical protein